MSLKQHVVSNSMLIFSRRPMSGNMPSGSPAEIFTHGRAHRFNILYVFKNSVDGVLTTWLNSSATAVSVVLASSTGFNAAIFFGAYKLSVHSVNFSHDVIYGDFVFAFIFDNDIELFA